MSVEQANALEVQQIADIQNFAQAPEKSALFNFECKPEGILAVREADAYAQKRFIVRQVTVTSCWNMAKTFSTLHCAYVFID
jgi:hypothetical protein